MWKCQECGKKFKTTKAAERAVNNGCPKCGGVDIDLDSAPSWQENYAKRAAKQGSDFLDHDHSMDH